MNKGIMSGMAPVRLKDGGFPDLTGDGKVTQKDILKGRGVQGFAEGGESSVAEYVTMLKDKLDVAETNLNIAREGAGPNLAPINIPSKKMVELRQEYEGAKNNYLRAIRSLTEGNIKEYESKGSIGQFFSPMSMTPAIAPSEIKKFEEYKKIQGMMYGGPVMAYAEGGDADKRFMNLQRTAEDSGPNFRDFTDFIFDPTDPVDYAIAGLMIFPPAAIAARLIKLGVKGNKLKNKMKKVEVMKDAQRSMGKKAKDLFTTNPIDNMAAANGLVLGGTRTGKYGFSAAGQLGVRNELADMATTNERSISRIGPAELYSYEARDQIREDPSLVKKGGIGEYVEIGSDLYDIVKDPEGREVLAEVIKESLPSMPNVFGTVDDEILNRRDGGIASFKTGGLAKGGKTILKKTKEKIKLKKDGTPDKRSQPKTKTPDKPKSSGTKINEKVAQAKPKQTPAQKKAAAERKRQATNKKAAQQRQADIDAKAKANADARRKADTDEFNQRQNPVGPVKPPGGTPKTGGGVPEGDVVKPGLFQRAKKPAFIGGALVAGATLIPGMFEGDGSEEDRPVVKDVTITDDDIFNQDTDAVIPDRDPTAWAEIMKARIVNDRGIPLDDKGNFTTKPKFMDYLKSLPGAYSDKVQRDPDFAKKMMAGFLNMMKPVEGYVPINSAVAFGEGYLGEETRQADMLPADAKMLKFLQANPDLYDKYLESESAKAGVLLSDIKAEQGTTLFNQLVDTVAGKQNISLDQVAKGNYQLTYQGIPVGPSDITSILDQGVSIVGNPDFRLEIK